MLLKLVNLLKRKSMKIADSHRHISESEHQSCIANALFLPEISFERTVQQFNVIGHGFI